MFGENNWTKINSPLVKDPDVYRWEDTKKYTDRLKEAKKMTGQDNAILSCEAKINDIDVVVSAVNFKFIGGSISMNEGENVLASVQKALEKKCPYIFISASGGMRMMTNMLSLMQMTRMTVGISELKKNNLPYVVVIASPSTGGLQASIASTGDICIGERNATMAFAGKRIVEATEKTDLPDDFQTVEWQMKKGQVDMVLDRNDIAPTIGTLLSILLKKNSAISIEENETSENSQSLTREVS
jgi:acetyl-CoA carboxylase carboxyl transferase subunit beta